MLLQGLRLSKEALFKASVMRSVIANGFPKFEPKAETVRRVGGLRPPSPLDNPRVLFVLGFSFIVALSLLTWPLLPRRYEAPATIVLLAPQPTSLAGNADVPRGPVDDDVIQSEIDLIGSRILASRVAKVVGVDQDPEFNETKGLINRAKRSASQIPFIGYLFPLPPVDADEARRHLESHLLVSRDRRSYTVKLGYWSNDASKAAQLTRELLREYMNFRTQRSRETIERTTSWMDKRVNALRADAERSQGKVQSFLDESGLIDAGLQTSLEQQLAAMSSELAQVRTRAIDADTRVASLLEAQVAGKLQDAPDVIASTTVQKLKDLMASADAKPGAWAPEARALSDQIMLEANRIVAAAQSDASLWERRKALLEIEIKRIRDEMTVRRRAMTHLEDLQRDAKADRTVLEESLIRAKGQTAMSASVEPEIEVLAFPETPLRAAFPDPLLMAIGTILVASIAGFALARRPRTANVFSATMSSVRRLAKAVA